MIWLLKALDRELRGVAERTSAVTDTGDERTIGELFVAKLIDQVRDPAVAAGLSLVNGEYSGALGAAWAAADDAERLQMAACNGVDEAIFRLLDAIDNAAIELRWVRNPDEQPVELVGSTDFFGLETEYIGEDGWRNKYSQQPYYEY